MTSSLGICTDTHLVHRRVGAHVSFEYHTRWLVGGDDVLDVCRDVRPTTTRVGALLLAEKLAGRFGHMAPTVIEEAQR